MQELLQRAIEELQTPGLERFALVVDFGDTGTKVVYSAGNGADAEANAEWRNVAGFALAGGPSDE